MATISSIIFVLLLLTACGDSGYQRSYIISDGEDEEVVPEPVEKRQI